MPLLPCNPLVARVSKLNIRTGDGKSFDATVRPSVYWLGCPCLGLASRELQFYTVNVEINSRATHLAYNISSFTMITNSCTGTQQAYSYLQPSVR